MKKGNAAADWEIFRLQRESAIVDRPSRFIGVLAACLMALVYLPTLTVVIVSGIYLLCEALIAHLDMRFLARPSRPVYVAIMAISFLGILDFTAISALLWQHDEIMVRFAAILFLVGALLNVSVVRAIHLISGVIYSLPPAMLLLWLPLSELSRDGSTRAGLFALACVIILLSYFAIANLNSHRNHARLIEARKRAENSDRAKSRFLSAMSHEMNTPLNALLGTLPLLRDATDPAQRQEMAETAERAGLKLQTLIDDALDFASTESGNITLRRATAAIRKELSQSLMLIQQRYGIPESPEALDVGQAVPEMGQFDPIQTRRCIRLIADLVLADRHDLDEFRLTCDLDENRSDTLKITLSLPDADTSATGGSPGDQTLTLTLARRIANALGGTIGELPEAAGVGVTFRLPYRPLPPLPDRERENGKPIRALVVDDLATNRFVVVRSLELLGITSIEAASGPEALNRLGDTDFDVVLLDMNMPVMNGEQTLCAIRSANAPWSDVPAIALTADTLPEQRDRYLALGLSGYVPKPVDTRVLWSEILNATRPNA